MHVGRQFILSIVVCLKIFVLFAVVKNIYSQYKITTFQNFPASTSKSLHHFLVCRISNEKCVIVFFFCIWCVFCIWLTSRFSFHLVSYLNITCLSVFMFRESMCVCVCTHLSLILSFTFHFLGFIDFFHYFLKFLGNYQFKYFFSLLFLELQFYIVKLTIWWSVLPPSFFFLFIFQ